MGWLEFCHLCDKDSLDFTLDRLDFRVGPGLTLGRAESRTTGIRRSRSRMEWIIVPNYRKFYKFLNPFLQLLYSFSSNGFIKAFLNFKNSKLYPKWTRWRNNINCFRRPLMAKIKLDMMLRKLSVQSKITYLPRHGSVGGVLSFAGYVLVIALMWVR